MATIYLSPHTRQVSPVLSIFLRGSSVFANTIWFVFKYSTATDLPTLKTCSKVIKLHEFDHTPKYCFLTRSKGGCTLRRCVPCVYSLHFGFVLLTAPSAWYSDNPTARSKTATKKCDMARSFQTSANSSLSGIHNSEHNIIHLELCLEKEEEKV